MHLHLFHLLHSRWDRAPELILYSGIVLQFRLTDAGNQIPKGIPEVLFTDDDVGLCGSCDLTKVVLRRYRILIFGISFAGVHLLCGKEGP